MNPNQITPFPNHGPNHPRCREYHLRCKIDLLKHAYEDKWRDGSSRGMVEDIAVVLVPEITTQAEKFFEAWLPPPPLAGKEATPEDGTEIAGFIGNPIYEANDLCLRRRDRFYNKGHYMVLMTLSGEHELKKHLRSSTGIRKLWGQVFGQKIDVRILGQHEFHLAAYARKADLTLQKS